MAVRTAAFAQREPSEEVTTDSEVVILADTKNKPLVDKAWSKDKS